MTCKDCLHHESCEYYGNSGVAYAVFYDEDKAEECPLFKDRSKWVEQKHGRGIEVCDAVMIGKVTRFECPECGTWMIWGRLSKFCPVCGELMTEGSEGE